MSSAASFQAYPLRVFDVVIRRVQDLGGHFRRITFAGAALDRFGVPGPTLDLRVKLLLPVPGHPVSRPGTADGTLHEGWYQEWLRGDQASRGFLRSYTVRAVRTTPAGRELDVDFALHAATGGPASDWALAAAPGQGILFIGPDATAVTATTALSAAGIRWNPQQARRVLLAGDESAVPAISSILEDLPAGAVGHAFLEVEDPADFLAITTGSGVSISWLARTPSQAPRGALLEGAVRQALGTTGPLDGQQLYAWVAAEAGTVKILRRYLVGQLGLDPGRSEFRAYWSLGKAGSGSNGTPLVQPHELRVPAAAGAAGTPATLP